MEKKGCFYAGIDFWIANIGYIYTQFNNIYQEEYFLEGILLFTTYKLFVKI